ncbi:accessory gene regulator B family protein [Lacrimispora brassicae]
MISNITNHVVQNLLQAKIIDQEDIVVYKFGIETLLSDVLNLVTIVMIGAFMGQLCESLIFQLIFISLRSWAGGYHASSEWKCWVLSNAMVIGVLLLSRHLPVWLGSGVGLLLLLAAVGVILFLAPVESENNLMDSDEVRSYKRRARMIVLISVFSGILLYSLSNSFFWILVLAVLSVAFSLVVGTCASRWKREHL